MPAFERVTEATRKTVLADIVPLRDGPPLSRERRILRQNQSIPSFPRKRESMRSQSVTDLDFLARAVAGKATAGGSKAAKPVHAPAPFAREMPKSGPARSGTSLGQAGDDARHL